MLDRLSLSSISYEAHVTSGSDIDFSAKYLWRCQRASRQSTFKRATGFTER